MESAAAASSSLWHCLPSDLLCEISCLLHAPDDLVRFHAVCRRWRATLPREPAGASRPPPLLPWLLGPRDSAGRRVACCVFSSSSTRGGDCAARIVRDRRWVVSTADGAAVAACLPPSHAPSFPVIPGGELVTGCKTVSLPRLRYPDPDGEPPPSWLDDDETRTVAGDGTVFLHGVDHQDRETPTFFQALLLRPGDAEWTTSVPSVGLGWLTRDQSRRCCVAYGNAGDQIVLFLDGDSWCVSTKKHGGGAARTGDDDDDVVHLPRVHPEPGRQFRSTHVLESRGEVLLVSIQVRNNYCASNNEVLDCRVIGKKRKRRVQLQGNGDALSVTVHALQQQDAGPPCWVQRDGRSLLSDRVLFLGLPSSFALDAATLHGGGGCVYFVLGRKLKRSRAFKYSFSDSKLELLAQLPREWRNGPCVWLRPQPAIAPIEEIEDRIEAAKRRLQLRLESSKNFATREGGGKHA